ncbi:MAG: hypothetical protein HQK50_16565 [Oligoflexia bacterium]|nr:hypothetical protein [Oligoflexia bacterium]MBF0367191.1 hypothetical protein [Oligoflexia bacterium]
MFISKSRNLLCAFSLIAISSSAFPMAAWDNNNRPELMSYDYNRSFRELPLSAKLPTLPWSDHYWPTYMGGISYRWNVKSAQDVAKYGYKLLDTKQLNHTADLSSLSPAEKYDIYLGRYDFPLTKHERERTNILATVPGSASFDASFTIPQWEGLCHAWAPATMLFKNPKPVTVTNANGIAITFGSSDIKALLTYFLHSSRADKTNFLGSRCNLSFADLLEKVRKGQMSEAAMKKQMNSAECNDTNAGAFHVALTNQIAFKKEGFVADVTRDAEVWNQPVYAYETKILAEKNGATPGAAAGTAREVTVETIMYYISEVDQHWNFVENHNSIQSKTYQYRVELNHQGKIIGGEWLSEDRPDFIWKQTRPEFHGFFAPLKSIYVEATR